MVAGRLAQDVSRLEECGAAPSPNRYVRPRMKGLPSIRYTRRKDDDTLRIDLLDKGANKKVRNNAGNTAFLTYTAFCIFNHKCNF